MTARHFQTRRPTPEPTRGERRDTPCKGHEALFDAAMPSQPWGPPMDRDAAEAALNLCAGCPVRDVCLTKLADDPWHVRAGTTPRQRRNTRKDPA